MPRSAKFWLEWTKRANAALDALLYELSVYGVPIAIAVMSVIALFAFDRQYAAETGTPLELQVLEQAGDAPEPKLALAQLAKQPRVQHFDRSV